MKHKHMLFTSAKAIGAVFAVAAVLGGCRSSKKSAEAGHAPLLATQWNIAAIQGKPVPRDVDERPFIVFDTNGNYYGSLSCNSFFGEYAVRKDKIRMSYTGATKKLCQNMEVEDDLLRALKAEINSYQFKGATLFLYADRTEILKLEP